MTQSQIYQAYFERRRRTSLLYRTGRYRNRLQLAKIRLIREYLAGGGDPQADPDIYRDYLELVDEYGIRVFELDGGSGILETEDSGQVF